VIQIWSRNLFGSLGQTPSHECIFGSVRGRCTLCLHNWMYEDKVNQDRPSQMVIIRRRFQRNQTWDNTVIVIAVHGATWHHKHQWYTPDPLPHGKMHFKFMNNRGVANCNNKCKVTNSNLPVKVNVLITTNKPGLDGFHFVYFLLNRYWAAIKSITSSLAGVISNKGPPIMPEMVIFTTVLVRCGITSCSGWWAISGYFRKKPIYERLCQ
jgi:hypothetical protein